MENLANFFNLWLAVKAFFVLALFLYFLFSLVVVRQAQLMIKVLDGKLNPLVKMVAAGHSVAAGLIFLLALLIL